MPRPRVPLETFRAAAEIAEPPALRKGLQALAGVLGLAAIAVIFDYKSVRGFHDEQDFAVAMHTEGWRPQPHRCNDRVEDFCQVWTGAEGSILGQGRASIRMMFKCLASKPGQEPTDPYLVLRSGDRHYIDPSARVSQQQQQQQQQQQS